LKQLQPCLNQNLKRVEFLFFFLFFLQPAIFAGSEIIGSSDSDSSVLFLKEWPESDLEENLARGYRSRLIVEIRKHKMRLFPWRNLTSGRDKAFSITKTIQQDFLSGLFIVSSESEKGVLENDFELLKDALTEFVRFHIILSDNSGNDNYEYRFILEPVILKSPLNMITLFMSNQYKSNWNEIPGDFFP